MSIRMKKVKVTKEKKIMMVYEKKVKGFFQDEYQFTSSEEAIPEFYQALAALTVDVAEICEFPEGYEQKIRVRGVSFSYGGENETLGATISASLHLRYSNSDLNINTPHKIEDYYNGISGDEFQLLPEECVKRLYEVIQQCEEYIQGRRAQGNLFEAQEGSPLGKAAGM